MDMTYRILWIDDNVSDLEGSKKLIETRLVQRSLKLDVTFESTISQEKDLVVLINKLRKHNPYDMIMVDYDLGSSVGGVTVLKRLRNIIHGILVLYSATPLLELRQRVYDNSIDGVFCLTRTSLRTQLFPIIEASLNKFKTPVTVRGLVVGTVGEIDNLLVQIANSLLVNNYEQAQKDQIIERIKKLECHHIKDSLEKLDTKYSRPIERVIRDMNFYQKKELLTHLLNDVGCQTSIGCIQAIEDFMENINPLRIDLAHSKTIMIDGHPVISKKDGGHYSPTELTQLMTLLSTIKGTIEDTKLNFCGE